MKRNSIFLVNSTHKTKPWWTTVSVLVLVLIPFIILWILACEFNLLDTNWLIAKNASVWHGTVTNDNISILAQKYGIFHEGGQTALLNELNKYIGSGKMGSIVSYKTFFNPVVLAPILGLLALAIAYPIVLNATKVSGLDVLPFSSAIGMVMTAMIFSGLIPHWGQDLMVWYWIVRLLIGLVIGLITFFIANHFVNKFLASRSYAADIFFGYKTNDEKTKYTREQLKENIDIYKHNKDEDKDYVEIEQEVK